MNFLEKHDIKLREKFLNKNISVFCGNSLKETMKVIKVKHGWLYTDAGIRFKDYEVELMEE